MTKPSRHIFLSYAAEDRSRVASLANLLEAEGWPVWWDRENLPPGQRFHRVIDQAIQNAFCVLVCWSEASIDSDWVMDEAGEAKQQKKLLPVLFEDVRPPYGYRSYHYIDLSRWNGESDQVSYKRLIKAIAGIQQPQMKATEEQENIRPHNLNRVKTGDRILQSLIDRLNDPSVQPKERLSIGDELAILGDPRPGTGLDEQGLPDIDWVRIPAGAFLYGENNETRELASFHIARYPVTNIQFQAFIDDGGYEEGRWWEGLAKRIKTPGKPEWTVPNRPRETVSWYEAMAFCRWLSDKLGYTVQLPMGLQWERAARGTNGRIYPWGEKHRSGYANVDETWNKQGPHNLKETAAVGVYPQGESPAGVQDMAGNIWEWCLDDFNNPENIGQEGSVPRVLRGGSWFYSPDDARSSERNGGYPDDRGIGIGLRILCSSPIPR